MVGDSWTRCEGAPEIMLPSGAESSCPIPSDIKKDLIELMNRLNLLENELMNLKAAEQTLQKLKTRLTVSEAQSSRLRKRLQSQNTAVQEIS